MKYSHLATLICLIMLTLNACAESPNVNKWKTYKAKESPSFKMVFPAKVDVRKDGSGRAYSSAHRWSPLLATRVNVTTGVLNSPASEHDPEAVMNVFIKGRNGRITGKKIAQEPNGFALIFRETSSDDGIATMTFHNVHLLGKSVYDVSYSIIASKDTPKAQIKKAIGSARTVLGKFRPLP